jgi:DNA-binding HxlR family transcriptional regulator
MVRGRSHDEESRACDVGLTRAFDFLGKRWNGVILGTLGTGPATFTELRRAVAGISDSVLSDRLTELATAGLIQRSAQEGSPVTVNYELTAAGQALNPAMKELVVWANEWATENLPAAVIADKSA